jgi:N-methylhydantoinase B
MNLLCRDGEVRELPAKCRLTIRRGDALQHVLGGAGGWGDPAERDPARVAYDVAEGKLSAEHAHREYGVSVDSVTAELLR